MASGITHTLFFVHLGIILILVLGFYSGVSGRVRAVYLFSLCVHSLLSSRFIASALVWFYNVLNYLVFLHSVHPVVCRKHICSAHIELSTTAYI
jgi:hypothetical protein